MSRKTAICALLIFVFCPAVRAGVCDFVVTQEFALKQKPHGVNGKLQLSMDARLTGPARDKMWGHGDWSFALKPEMELYKDFSAFPPCNAKLQIKDDKDKLVFDRFLNRQLAKLEELDAVGNSTFLLTVDYSTGFGSYAGLETSLLQVAGAGLRDLDALDVSTQQREPIRLAKSLKSGWTISKVSNGLEVLSLWCRPTPNGATFNLMFTRYSFDGNQWLAHKRQEKGFWESDQPFPPRSAFP